MLRASASLLSASKSVNLHKTIQKVDASCQKENFCQDPNVENLCKIPPLSFTLNKAKFLKVKTLRKEF